MNARILVAGLSVVVGGAALVAQAPRRHNPMVELLQAKKPVFGLYAPTPPRGPRAGAAAPATPAPPVVVKTQAELAKDAMAYAHSDFLFTGSLERGIAGLPAWAEFVNGLGAAGLVETTPSVRLTRAIVAKTPKITDDAAKTASEFSAILNTGVNTLMFVGVESAAEVQQGLDAMRFAAKGGKRPDTVGDAPKVWGLSEAAYKAKADLWPLNPNGELVNWTIVESKEGIAKVREIAAVKGIGVLWPGAGTLRGVYSTTNAAGERVADPVAWEAAIQQVLAACKEFNVPCGYPANATDIEMRMKQGFSVFVMNWGDAGFAAVEAGRKAAGRSPEAAQERAPDGVPVNAAGDPQYSTFSLCAIDPATKQSGAAVTTRVPFVGRAVPHVRAGVGAVCTQASTMVEFGAQGLNLIEKGVAPADIIQQLLAPDERRETRQLGVIDMQGRSAAHTGKQNGAWAGSKQGLNYTVQANIMVGPEVIEAVAAHFESTEGLGMPLAERMILAIEAGYAKGGDKRWGLLQSAAIKIADPNNPGRGGDHIALAIEVGEHPTPVAEMKRIYMTTARRLGYRDMSRIEGADVIELKRMLHALGLWRPTLAAFPEPAPAREYGVFDDETIAAVDKFRTDNAMNYQGNPPGLVDARFVDALRAAYFKTKKK
jgi:uncharacterized Ntn-hydrolase superfamily protein/2-keto-3-deoxy-L-rhamnonate aldolase RhmA